MRESKAVRTAWLDEEVKVTYYGVKFAIYQSGSKKATIISRSCRDKPGDSVESLSTRDVRIVWFCTREEAEAEYRVYERQIEEQREREHKKNGNVLEKFHMLTVKEGADYARIGRTLMYGLIHDGTIPAFRPDSKGRGKLLLDRADIDNWLSKRKTG